MLSCIVTVIGTIVVFSVFLAALFLMSLYRAWAASILWGWFMVPLGLPMIGVLPMVGVMIVLGSFRSNRENMSQFGKAKTRQQVKKLWSKSWPNMLTPVVGVALGYVLKFWIMK